MAQKTTTKTSKNNVIAIRPLSTKDKRLAILYQHGIIDTVKSPARQVHIIEVTPEMATDLLQCNIYNRNKVASHTNQLRHSMERGKFQLTNDAICFDYDGNLTNAQHRLEAVSSSGVSCEFIIAYGIEFTPDMDCGRKRSLLDNIKLFGYGIDEKLRVKGVVSIATNCCRYMSKTSLVSYDEIIEFILHYQQQLLDFIDIASGKYGSAWHKTALFMMYIGKANGSVPYSTMPLQPTLNECKEFYSVFVSNASNLPKHNPIRAVHNATSELFASGYGGADAHKKEMISIVQDAMNQFLMGTCTNVLDKYIPENMYPYDMQFLNVDINGLPMRQFKYR